MQKVLIHLVVGATLAGCGGGRVIDRLPFVYQMPVQQGNIITDEMVDRLQPAMTKSQVRYLMGTPMLEDIFHADRWDYTYTIRRPHQETQIKRLTLFFDKDGNLHQVEGYIRPNPARLAADKPNEIIVTVPNWKDERGILSRAFSTIGLEPTE
jgi:outer membrane protein assembly factor BamE